MQASDLTSLYKNHPAYFWLEDEDTRAYFSQIWPNERFGYLVGGGEQNIRAVVEAAHRQKLTHVFGIVDRDFYNSNVARWAALTDAERIYRLPVHEFENFLLDADALAGCKLNTQRRTSLEIDNRMKDVARDLVWWMATKRVLGEVHRGAVEGFPEEPGRQKVQSLATALDYISKSAWFASKSQGIPGLASPHYVEERLKISQTEYDAAIQSGHWRTEFSGKEIFRTVQNFVYPGSKGPAGRADLTKAIARWQRENARIPKDIESLRGCVRGRLGIS